MKLLENEKKTLSNAKISDTEDFNSMWENNTSATIASTAANYIMRLDKPFTSTYRTYIKPREYGNFKWRFWHCNAVDSTWDDGANSAANDIGGNWIIESVLIADGGRELDGSIEPGTSVQVTFNGSSSKEVPPGEKFWSDSVLLNIPEEHYIAFTWTIRTTSTGKVLPYNIETLLMSSYVASGNCAEEEQSTPFKLSENCMVMPNLIAYEKPVLKKLCFIGDSITQGVRNKIDKYEYWVSKIAEGLGSQIGVWNIGSGWARAYDAASDCGWLFKAKQSEEVIICLGVNDIGTVNRNYEELLTDLTTIVRKLKENNPSCKIIMFTVPTFNFTGEQEKVWRTINNTIRRNPPKGVDKVFDIADILSLPAPNDNMIRPEFKSGVDDPHPNGLAGTTIAEAFLKWYCSNKVNNF